MTNPRTDLSNSNDGVLQAPSVSVSRSFLALGVSVACVSGLRICRWQKALQRFRTGILPLVGLGPGQFPCAALALNSWQPASARSGI
jgi:hypothetical protein